jgi:hypothetical protein
MVSIGDPVEDMVEEYDKSLKFALAKCSKDSRGYNP